MGRWLASLFRRIADRLDPPRVPAGRSRFRVEVSGESGGDARRVWEALLANQSVRGALRFYDGDACRGDVTR